MAVTKHLVHMHSKVVTNDSPKLPNAETLELGELAVNYAKGYETISLRNDNNEVVTFSGDAQINKVIEDNEKVTSAALNNLDGRVIGLDEAKQDKLTAGDNITIQTVNDVLKISATDTTYDTFTSSANGLVPAPNESGNSKFLCQNGTWLEPYQSLTEAENGKAVSLVTTGDKYAWNRKGANIDHQQDYADKNPTVVLSADTDRDHVFEYGVINSLTINIAKTPYEYLIVFTMPKYTGTTPPEFNLTINGPHNWVSFEKTQNNPYVISIVNGYVVGKKALAKTEEPTYTYNLAQEV